MPELVPWLDASTLACIDDADQRASTLAAASELLSAPTSVGLVTDEARPCGPSGCSYWPRSRWDVLSPRWNGLWWGTPDAGRTSCGCTSAPAVHLPGAVSVESVTIDGVELAANAYVLDDEWLYRLDGDRWPACQNTLAPSTEVGTFAVAYTRGIAPGAAAQLAVSQLACYLWRYRDPQACGLPANARQVTRQGITYDLAAFLEDGKATGLPLVDAFLATYAGRRTLVYNPDVQRSRGRVRL